MSTSSTHDAPEKRLKELMQFQSDILGIPVVRPKNAKTTAKGAAYPADLATGFYKSTDEISTQWAIDRTFESQIGAGQRDKLRSDWNKAVLRAKAWAS